MAIEHVDITDPDIHEPKGVAAASASQVYVADGAGSGDWRYIPHSSCYYSNLGTGTTITAPTSMTVVNPVTSGDTDPKEFTHNSAGRLTYTGSTTMDFNVNVSMTVKHSSASLVDIQVQLYKNGTTAVAGTLHATAALSGNYTHVTICGHLELTTNDYIEVFVLSASGNVIVHTFSMTVEGKL